VTQNALADRLLSLTEVTALVGTFRSLPAIFSESPVPPSATGRYIVIRDAHVDEPWESKEPQSAPTDMIITRGRMVHHDIGIYEDTTGDSSTVEDLAELVRNAFNRYLLPISGYGTLIAKARGPIKVSDDENIDNQVDGRVVTVELTIIKAS
jgi:hypothetical protein